MNLRRAGLLSLAVFTFSSVVAADNSELRRCAARVADTERLACYDRLAAGLQPAASPQKTPVTAAPKPAAAPASSTAAATAKAEARFGAEVLPRRTETDSPESIRSRIVGVLDGWQKGDIFRLENGQVWKCIDDRGSFQTMSNPEVGIRRGFLGSYFMRFEGTNTQLRVRRIE